ncbi:MAG: hypothetical protein GY870_01600 [archaeon]|nr:hypothetical protein [archaeon]
MPLIHTIIALIIIIIIFPVIGKKIYQLNSKKTLFPFSISIGVLFGIIMVFSSPIDLTRPAIIISIYLDHLIPFNFFFVLILVFYVLGGLGFIGSLSEFSGEIIEDINLFTEIKKRTTPKSYLMYLIYGYVFSLGVYSANMIFRILLGIEFNFVDIQLTIDALFFESILIQIVGISLYFVKAFTLGFFSREFFRGNLSYKETERTFLRYIRKLIVIFFFVWGNYLFIILFFIETLNIPDPFGSYAIESLKLFFFLSCFIECLYFYRNRDSLIDQRKMKSEDFKQKIDKDIKLDTDTDEIKFD